MENEELMNTTEFDETENTEETEEENNSRSALGVVGLMAIGSGLTLGIIAGAKKLKKVWADHKAKKDAAKNAPEVIEVEAVPVEPAEEQKPAPQAEEAEE